MKIYIINVDNKYQLPPRKIRAWPEHSIGFNVEIAFLDFLLKSNFVTKNPDEADWHYLPLMWSYWQLSNNYGRDNRSELQRYLDKIILDDYTTFTVSEADNEPGFDIGRTVVFSANQKDGWIPIPIITLPHQVPGKLPKKKYLSNFVGTVKPWHVRVEMQKLLENRTDVKIEYSKKGESKFVNTILESYSTLCPRGSALSSYRFYETMQLGVVPIMIADYDMRPFPDRIDWESCSYFINDVKQLPVILDNFYVAELEGKGNNAKEIWNDLFKNWPDYVLDILDKK